MERRQFLRALVGGIATATAVRTFPFRVFSFPTKVVPSNIRLGVDWGFDPAYEAAYQYSVFFVNKDGIWTAPTPEGLPRLISQTPQPRGQVTIDYVDKVGKIIYLSPTS